MTHDDNNTAAGGLSGGYFNVDTDVVLGPRAEEAGAYAMWLYVCADSYCAHQRTGGFISNDALGYLSMHHTMDDAERFAARLVAVGLWEVVPGGWRSGGFMERNPHLAGAD